MDELISIINNVGFPIVACIFMANNNTKLNGIILDLTTTLKTIDTRLQILEKERE